MTKKTKTTKTSTTKTTNDDLPTRIESKLIICRAYLRSIEKDLNTVKRRGADPIVLMLEMDAVQKLFIVEKVLKQLNDTIENSGFSASP